MGYKYLDEHKTFLVTGLKGDAVRLINERIKYFKDKGVCIGRTLAIQQLLSELKDYREKYAKK